MASPFAFGQNASRLQLAAPAAPEVKRVQGRLQMVAFRDGVPADGVVLHGPFGTVHTGADGTFACELDPGNYSFRVHDSERDMPFRIVGAGETQITLQLNGAALSDAQVAAPEAEFSAARDETSAALKTVRLQVVGEDGTEPVADATLLIAGQPAAHKTDVHGIADMKINADGVTLSVFHPKYQTQTLNTRSLTGDPARITMRPAGNDLEEVVVLAPKLKGNVSALVEVRRKSSAVTDVLGSEQMARQGDSDAAGTLRRVTGLTLMNGKYVYVRGLGERYSSVLMNQFALPSPEPSRRVVPLDLFPTSILESVIVQKSYSPDLPAEFGGGIIQLQTRSLPERPFFNVSLSSRSENAEDRLGYHGGAKDWLGVDDGTRRMPAKIRSALSAGKKFVVKQPGSDDGISQSELTALGRSLPNTYAVSTSGPDIFPNASIATGNRFPLGGAKLGAAGSLLYGQDADNGTRLNRGLNAIGGGRFTEDYSRTTQYTEVETRLAGSIDLGLTWKKQFVGFNTFLLRNTSNLTQEQVKRDPNSISAIENTTLDWTERQLWTKHFRGKHDLSLPFRNEIAWRAGWSDASRLSPDRREYSFERTPTSLQMRSDSGGNRRTWSELADSARDFGLDWTLPLSKESLQLKVGAAETVRARRADVFRFYFLGTTNGDPIEKQLAPGNIGPGGFQLRNLTDSADSYSGDQSVSAQYAMLDWAPVSAWSFQAGARHERSRQKVQTFRYFEPAKPFSTSEVEMNDVLPSYSVVWKPTDRLRARLAYSETLARPDFRELSEVGFVDDDTGYEVHGNSALKGTVIRNLDHRWEYYFTSDEYVSLGAFRKNFRDPIEVMFVPGVNRVQTFANAKAATNIGMEFESRVGLRHATRALRRWTVLSNLTLINSQIELDDANKGVQTSEVRPLQGQSPYVVNVQLQYDRPLWGLSVTALYNVIGKRIAEVGTNGVPDTYEQPFHQVDLVAGQALSKNWSLRLLAKNLLDPRVESYQGGELVRQTRLGRSVGVSLNGVF